MTPKKQLVAKFYNASYDPTGDEKNVADMKEALRESFQRRAFYFQTHEITTVEMGTQTLKSEPDHHPGRNYVGIDKLYTAAEVIASYQAELNGLPKAKNEFDGITAQVLREVIDEYKGKYGPHDRFIPDWRPGDFNHLGETDRAFDSQGKQVWAGAKTGPKFEL